MASLQHLPRIQSPRLSKRYLASGLPLGAIIGIAVGGALMLGIVLVSLFVRKARSNDRRARKRITEAIHATEEQIDFKSALQSTHPPDILFQRRSPCNPFFIHEEGIACRHCNELNHIQNPPMAKAKILADRRGFFRFSGMRDSWPLASGIPLSFLPPSQSMVLNQVAPPGYMVTPPETKWPRRSSSKSAQSKILVHFTDSDIESGSTESISLTPHPRPKFQRRSTSESHLSTILRSTSQRLKSAQRSSLTRTLSTFRQLPGGPPSEILPDLPRMESRALDEPVKESPCPESVGSSIYDFYLEPSPCLGSKNITRVGSRHGRSPTPSVESEDSLCANQPPDLVIPATLTSPSKRKGRYEQRHQMSISRESKGLTAIIRKNSRASIGILGDRKSAEENTIFASPHRISLASDPIYSSVKSSKPVFPKTHIPDPRPLYVRKATFGQEATTERPLSYTSPLRDVSGNAQSPLRRNESMETVMNSSPERNPFQLSPQEAMQTRAATASPKRNDGRRKGHKRSNAIRISNLPRPQSIISVNVVPEEPEEESSPYRFALPFRPPTAIVEPSKGLRSSSPLSAKSNRRLSMRPPTSATFNPSLTVPEIESRSMDNSPTLGEGDIPNIYSPTLSVCNYYTEASHSENEFFQSKKPSSVALKLRRHGPNYSADFSAGEVGKLISFRPPESNPTTDAPISPPISPPSRPLSSITASSLGLINSKAPSPAPPLLTMPIPGHLTGPRPEPAKRVHDLWSPSRDSVPSFIGTLRRMNSDISQGSHYSKASVINEDGSPGLPAHKAYLSNTDLEEQERGRSRGSKFYLSVGQTPPKARRQAVEKRDSHRIYKERRLKRMNDETLQSETNDLTPVHEDASPATGSNALGIVGLRFPTVSASGIIGASPPKAPAHKSSSLSEGRWSDVMTVAPLNSVRRVSKMEHPSPQTPPKWGWGNKGLGIGLVETKAVLMDGKENSAGERTSIRPESLGLYDQDGFLKGSPGKEKVESGAERMRSFVM